MFAEKFIKKYIRMAKAISEENDACYSRSVGSIIVDKNHKVCGVGYNGAPRNTPHCDSKDFYVNYLYPKLNDKEIAILDNPFQEKEKRCPRKILGYKSGEKREYCSCICSEQNAINTASDDLHDCAIFIYPVAPCDRCAAAIVQAGISHVYYYQKDEPYAGSNRSSFWLLQQGGVKVERVFLK